MPFIAAFAIALALSTPQDPPPTVLEDIIVEGVRRNEETSLSFVREMSAPPAGSRSMAVWTKPLCLFVDNVSPASAAALAGQIHGRARDVGVEIGDPGCKPNVYVIFTADGAATAADLLRRNRANFRPTSGPTHLERGRLTAFANADRAVRWWTVNMPVDVNTGDRVVALAGEHIPVAHNPLNLGGPDCIPRVQCPPARMTGGPPWRAKRGMGPETDIHESLLMTMVVVDARLAAGASLPSLGDYLAMVALTQVDPDARLEGVPTILNLFSESPTATELSAWDMDYLRALYETPVEWSNIRFQQRDIARRMVLAAASRPGD